jgi:hypothetical protein
MINEVTHMLQRTSLTTPTTLSEKAVHDISGALMLLLSDVLRCTSKPRDFIGICQACIFATII